MDRIAFAGQFRRRSQPSTSRPTVSPRVKEISRLSRRVHVIQTQTYSKGIADLFHIDLVDLSNLASFNDGEKSTALVDFTSRKFRKWENDEHFDIDRIIKTRKRSSCGKLKLCRRFFWLTPRRWNAVLQNI